MSSTPTKSFWQTYWPLYAVAFMAVVVIAARIRWPSLTFDNISLILFGIASLSILLPYLLRGLPPLKKFKFGDYELEFEEKLKLLETKVVESEREIQETQKPARHAPLEWQEYFREYSSIIGASTSNVEKILAASNLVDRMIFDVAQAFDIEKANRRKNTRAIIGEMESQGLITAAERAAFGEFSNLRNQVVHGGIESPNDSQTARFLDLGWRLVRTLA